MYCRNCGTVVPGNEEYCEACRMEQLIHKAGSPSRDMSHEGRGQAIASLCMSAVGFFSTTTIITQIAEAGGLAPILAAILSVGVVVGIILSLVFGIRGIAAFGRAARYNAQRPVASLVCGVIGVVLACITLCYLLSLCGAFSMSTFTRI